MLGQIKTRVALKGEPSPSTKDILSLPVIKLWVGFVYFLNFHIFGIGMELRTGNNLSEQLFAQILNSGSKGGHANLTVCASLYRPEFIRRTLKWTK